MSLIQNEGLIRWSRHQNPLIQTDVVIKSLNKQIIVEVGVFVSQSQKQNNHSIY